MAQVSFIDGAGGTEVPSAGNAMFRCKSLLHTTGLGPRVEKANDPYTGWEGGHFQFEVTSYEV